jgi:hypothetical protein
MILVLRRSTTTSHMKKLMCGALVWLRCRGGSGDERGRTWWRGLGKRDRRGTRTPRMWRRCMALVTSRPGALWRQGRRPRVGQRGLDWEKLQIFELCDQNARYESCRWDIGLQLLQRAKGVSMNESTGNTCQSSGFSWRKTLFIWPLTEFLSFESSKFEMPPI